MFYEEIPSNSEILRNLKSTSDLELMEIDFYKVTVDQHEGQVVGLFKSENKMLGIDFNSIEGTMLTFVVSGCHENSHLRTVYQLYLETMEMLKFKLEKIVIEAKRGDMIYARLHWIDHKNRKIFKICSAGDATVLAILADSETFIIKSVYDEMEDFTEYDNNLLDSE